MSDTPKCNHCIYLVVDTINIGKKPICVCSYWLAKHFVDDSASFMRAYSWGCGAGGKYFVDTKEGDAK